jgi:hypothetical protein
MATAVYEWCTTPSCSSTTSTRYNWAPTVPMATEFYGCASTSSNLWGYIGYQLLGSGSIAKSVNGTATTSPQLKLLKFEIRMVNVLLLLYLWSRMFWLRYSKEMAEYIFL